MKFKSIDTKTIEGLKQYEKLKIEGWEYLIKLYQSIYLYKAK